MQAWQIIVAIMSSSVVVALINLLIERLRRKDVIKDRKENNADNFKHIGERITALESNINGIMAAQKAQSYDRIRFLSTEYIKRGYIDTEELRVIMDMHNAYKALGGNGFLDKLMQEVTELPLHTL